MFFQEREELREALLSAKVGDVSITGLTLPIDTYRELGREHQFAIELQLENKSRMDLKVLDDEEDSGAYYVYVATTGGNFIDAWGFYDDEQELLQKYRMRLFRKGRSVPSRLIIPQYSSASRLKSKLLKPFIGNEWYSDDLREGDVPDETDYSDDDEDYDGEFIDLSTLERDRINMGFLPSIEIPLNQGAIDESNRLFRIRGQSEEMRAIELANLWEDFEEREICMACGEYMANCAQDEMQFGCKPRKYPKIKPIGTHLGPGSYFVQGSGGLGTGGRGEHDYKGSMRFFNIGNRSYPPTWNRRIDGKTFRIVPFMEGEYVSAIGPRSLGLTSKQRAKKTARQLRASGFNARVIKKAGSKTLGVKNLYSVYWRPSKRRMEG